MADEAMTDFSRTKRIVFFIDLDPLLHLQNPNSYLNCILSSAKTILSFPSLSSSLFSFKPFFSSLSPVLSSSKLRNFSLHLSFNDPQTTLESLRETFNSLAKFPLNQGPVSLPRASNVATNLRQLLHDYSWDMFVDEDSPLGTSSLRSTSVKSNLTVMFSPICRTRKWVSDFMGTEAEDGLFTTIDVFSSKFSGAFRSVNDAFVIRDIHVSWIDVKHDPENETGEIGSKEFVPVGLFESGICSLGWGFCSTESIVSGTVLVPFGLIYPSIGISPKMFDFGSRGKRIRTHLGLEISDVNGQPLQCKYCELELVKLKHSVVCGMDSDGLLSQDLIQLHGAVEEGDDTFLEQLSDSAVKVEAVQKHENFAKMEERFSERFIAREYSEKSHTIQKDGFTSEFFADRLLDILAAEMGEVVRKYPPTWQIFLSFMYKEGYSALVSLSQGNGNKLFGILKPFTSSFAVISVTKEKSYLDHWLQNIELHPQQLTHKVDNRVIGSSDDVHAECLISRKHDRVGIQKKKKSRNNLLRIKNVTWHSFQKEEFEGLDINLEELYFAREGGNSKKLMFLKCWVKQVKGTILSGLSRANGSKPRADTPLEDDRLENLHQESEPPISASPSCGEDSMTAASAVQDEVANDCGLDSSVDFLREVPNKIFQGLQSEGVDLGSLAERLVHSSIYWLYQNSEIKVSSDCRLPPEKAEEASGSRVAAELMQLILREPKDLEEKSKITDQAAYPDASAYAVREYELQIYFRMEIMRSEISASIKGSVKHKFVKQICLLLESIQCHLERGFFADWSLHDYVEKIIKSRYSKDLEEVVHQIYLKMDLLLFDGEDELPNSLLDSEENSDPSWRNRAEGEKMRKKEKPDKCFTAENDPQWPLQENSSRARGREHVRRLNEAQEKRERARRFASLTTWVPDLQRVWAPKNSKAMMKKKSDPARKTSKRKYQNDVVYETPMNQSKRSSARTDGINYHDDQDSGNHQCSSVCKALFMSEK